MSDIRFNRWLHQSGTGGIHQDSSGSIGIGTDDPGVILDIRETKTAGSAQIRLYNTDTSDTTTQTAEVSLTPDSRGLAGAGIKVFKENADFSTNADRDISLALNVVQNNSQTEVVRINSDGNVGIGTDNPAVQLDVYGEPPRIRLVRNSTGVRHELRGNADNLSIRADSSNIGADTIIDFQIDGSEKARIDSNGKVAIGTDSTTHELELYKQQNTGTVLEIQNPSTGAGAHARVGLDADVASLNFYSHGSGRNLERYGTLLNEWTEISNTAGNGIVIGTHPPDFG